MARIPAIADVAATVTDGTLSANQAAVRAAGMNLGDRAERTRRGQALDIELFTELTGDCNTLHYDAAGGPQPLGGIIVKGGARPAR